MPLLEDAEAAPTFDVDSVDDVVDEMKLAHDRVMKNLIDTSNSNWAKTPSRFSNMMEL